MEITDLKNGQFIMDSNGGVFRVSVSGAYITFFKQGLVYSFTLDELSYPLEVFEEGKSIGKIEARF
jgi:hypothetical protein